jgi:class 3 adenylate cyclase
LYSVNYDRNEDEFYYAIDGTQVLHDTIWIESERLSFWLTAEQTGIELHYNEKRQKQSLQIENLTVRYEPHTKILTFNGEPIFNVVSENPLEIAFLVKEAKGRTIHKTTREVFFTSEFAGTKQEWSFSFSAAGEPASDPGAEFVDDESTIEKIKELMNSGNDHVDEAVHKSSYGEYISSFALIRGPAKPSGIVMLDISAASIRAFENATQKLSITVFLAAFVLSLLLALLLTHYITGPVRVLSDAVQEMASGKLNIVVNWNSRDEFGELARNMTGMAGHLHQARDQILKINETFRKFVPADFLEFLRRKDLTEIRLGDQVEQHLTILFSDIRSFTSLSEKLTPEQSFSFINSYLNRMGPVIRAHNGFIDKYMGDGIMALFARSAEDAVLAAVAMRKQLNEYNKERSAKNYLPIEIGAGIHTGRMMLGIVGEEMRMDGTVISDAVNIASRMESLTKAYACNILISADVYLQLGSDLAGETRYLGPMDMPGKENKIEIYQVFAGEPDPLRERKKATRLAFEEAMRQLASGNLQQSRNMLQELLTQSGEDKTLKILLEQIDVRLQA